MRKQTLKLKTIEQKTIRELSDRIVKAQKPILILDSIKWGEDVKKDFFKHKCKKLPKVTETYYQNRSLGYDPNEKITEFYGIEQDIRKHLGEFNGASRMMLRMCREYQQVVEMLQYRGTKRFAKISQQLYGSADDVFYAGSPTLKDLAKSVAVTIGNLENKTLGKNDVRDIPAKEAVHYLSKKLDKYFAEAISAPTVELSTRIIADAAAGAEKISINKDVMFSKRMLRQLEIHEGWVHLGTTLNGKLQPICTFLSKGTPSSTTTQEGLAIIMEIITFTSFPERVKRITNRIEGIHMAEQGGDFLDVFNYFLTTGYSEDQAYYAAVRIFRGSVPNGKPFTKDLSYTRGFVQLYNYIRLAVHYGLVEHIPLLFVGKTSLEDLRIIVDLVEEGLVQPPKFIPKQFKDPAPLCAWATYSLFFNKLDLGMLELDFKNLLHK